MLPFSWVCCVKWFGKWEFTRDFSNAPFQFVEAVWCVKENELLSQLLFPSEHFLIYPWGTFTQDHLNLASETDVHDSCSKRMATGPQSHCSTPVFKQCAFFWGTANLKEKLKELTVTQVHSLHFTPAKMWGSAMACHAEFIPERPIFCAATWSLGPQDCPFRGSHTSPGTAPQGLSPLSVQKAFLKRRLISGLLPKPRHQAILPLGKVSNLSWRDTESWCPLSSA
jgi:hypothetical protein